jgi:hypothetical protein
VDAMLSEQVVGMAQNEWTASIGIDGRHDPDYATTTTRGWFSNPVLVGRFRVQ